MVSLAHIIKQFSKQNPLLDERSSKMSAACGRKLTVMDATYSLCCHVANQVLYCEPTKLAWQQESFLADYQLMWNSSFFFFFFYYNNDTSS